MKIILKPSDLIDYALRKDNYCKYVLLNKEFDYLESPYSRECIVLRLFGQGKIKQALMLSGCHYNDELNIFKLTDSRFDRESFLVEIDGLLHALRSFGL